MNNFSSATTHSVTFIGSSVKGLQVLLRHERFQVKAVLCLESRLTIPLRQLAIEQGLDLMSFQNPQELTSIVESQNSSSVFVIYQLDMLVAGELTSKYRFFNIHRGDLLTNRGPSPDVWPILLGHTSTSLSLHQINEKIDSGILVGEFKIPVLHSDDTQSLKLRLEEGLEDLFDSLDAYLNGYYTGRILEGGIYRPWIKEIDFTIDLENDDIATIDRKIRSQRTYNGAIVNYMNTKHYVLAYELSDRVEELRGVEPKDSILVIPFRGENPIVFTLNLNPKFKPPPTMPPSKRV